MPSNKMHMFNTLNNSSFFLRIKQKDQKECDDVKLSSNDSV